jgi:hypothetical protein
MAPATIARRKVFARARVAALALTVAVGASPASAQRVAVPTHGATPLGPSVLLSNADGENAYTGVVRVESRATCSGVFINPTAGFGVPSEAPAYVLTNGHCPAFPGPNDVLTDRTSPGRARVVFEYFVDTTARQYAVPIRRVALRAAWRSIVVRRSNPGAPPRTAAARAGGPRDRGPCCRRSRAR